MLPTLGLSVSSYDRPTAHQSQAGSLCSAAHQHTPQAGQAWKAMGGSVHAGQAAAACTARPAGCAHARPPLLPSHLPCHRRGHLRCHYQGHLACQQQHSAHHSRVSSQRLLLKVVPHRRFWLAVLQGCGGGGGQGASTSTLGGERAANTGCWPSNGPSICTAALSALTSCQRPP